MKTTLYVILIIVILFFIVVNHPKFGKIPRGVNLDRVLQSPNSKKEKFYNLNPTPQLAENANFLTILKDNFTAKNRRPKTEIPSVKTDLKNLDAKENVLVWFGHSSYFIQLDGKKFLVDPVFSGSASPFSFMIKAFKGSDVYSTEDIPDIDYLIITHDHWDHLDYKTVVKLQPKIKNVITGLGVGEHLKHWNFNGNIISELDWNSELDLTDGFKIYGTPARHFSGRGLFSNRSLWMSFVLETPEMKIFIGGDGGYDTHFHAIGKQFGEIDLAILENGQYNMAWKYIHMLPEEVLYAAKDLNAKTILPVHSGKFALANHTWDEPLKRITKANESLNQNLITPKIGEKVRLKDADQVFERWWENMN